MQDIERKLYRYQEYKQRIDELEQQIKDILAKQNYLTDWVLSAPRLSDVKVKGGPLPDPVFRAVQQMVDVYGTRIDNIRRELIDLYYLYDDLVGCVSRAVLTDQERQYVELRYFQGMRPGVVALKMDYGEDNARKIKNKALAKIISVTE